MSLLTALGFMFMVSGRQAVDARKTEHSAVTNTSISNILDGTFSSEFEQYYADQFPFRSRWIAVDQAKSRLLRGPSGGEEGFQIIAARRDMGGTGQQPAAFMQHKAQTVAQTNAQNADPSNANLHVPNAGQEPSPVSTLTTEATHATEPALVAEPTEPGAVMGPKAKAGMDADEADYQTYHLIIHKGRAMEIFGYGDRIVREYAGRLNHLRECLPAEKRLANMIVPTAVALYGPEELNWEYYSQYDAIRLIYEQEHDDIIKVDAYSELAQHTDEYIYFRTDHHWNGVGLLRLCCLLQVDGLHTAATQ